MCVIGIKQSYVLYYNSFFWYLYEYRYVYSLKIRQCVIYSVDNSIKRRREREREGWGYIENCSWKEVNFCIYLL